MLYALILFAQQGEQKAPSQPDPFGGMMMPLLLMMAAFFFLIVWPSQRKQKKEREALMTNLKKNDEVVTSAGIIGVVQTIKDNGDEVTLKIDDNARMRVLRSSIVRIVTKEEPKDGAASANATKPAN